MTVYLARRGYHYSPTTIHKHMNTEMKLFSAVRPKKPGYEHANRIKCLKTGFIRILLLESQIKNGVQICMNLQRKNRFAGKWRSLHMLTTIMYVHTVSMVIVPVRNTECSVTDL